MDTLYQPAEAGSEVPLGCMVKKACHYSALTGPLSAADKGRSMSDLLLKISCHPFWLFLSYPYLAENLFILYIPLTSLILNLVHFLASFALDVLYLFFISVP